MWKTVQIVGTAILAGFALIMQIKPEDASSNLSAWLSLVTDNVPSSFISPTADKWALAILALAAFLLWFGPWLYKRLKKSGQNPLLSSPKAHLKTQEVEQVSHIHADKYPDIRVADSTAVLDLFRGTERVKLIALLEAGSIKSWARSMAKGQTPPGVDTDLLALAPDAWSKHRLEHMPKRGEGTIAQTFLKTNERGYSAYYDVWLNSAQIAGVFPSFKAAYNPVATSRIPLLEFIELAENDGWDISGRDNLQILDLLDGLNQAGGDGDIRFWGRLNRNQFDSLARAERLIPIDVKHWVDFQIEPSAAITGSENFKTLTYDPRQTANRTAGYIDLHLEREAAKTWLRLKAKSFQGLRDARAKRNG